jgi:hypothetical protein
MKEEIEKILKDNFEPDGQCAWFNTTKAAIKLQKLFITSYMDSLTELSVGLDKHSIAFLNIRRTVSLLKSELNQLQ